MRNRFVGFAADAVEAWTFRPARDHCRVLVALLLSPRSLDDARQTHDGLVGDCHYQGRRQVVEDSNH